MTRHRILTRHLKTTIAVHMWLGLGHIWLHGIWHIAAARNESLRLWIELLAIVASRDRMLIAARLAIIGVRRELTVRIRSRHRRLMRGRHWTVPGTRLDI